MRVVVIGGSGHIGTYLIPILVAKGYEVVNITRGKAQPYVNNPAWRAVRHIPIDREAEERAGTFGQHVHNLKPDIVIDLICFRPDSARQIVEALRGEVQHFLHCGTIWVYGHSTQVPATEDQPCRPFGSYIDTRTIIAQDSRVVVENVMTATFVHDYEGVKATGRVFSVREAVFFDMQDGLIKDVRVYLDRKSQDEQLGLGLSGGEIVSFTGDTDGRG